MVNNRAFNIQIDWNTIITNTVITLSLMTIARICIRMIERIFKELAKLHASASFLTGKVIRRIAAEDVENVRRKLELTEDDLHESVEYLKTPEGRDTFKRLCLLELWKVGFRPKDWEE